MDGLVLFLWLLNLLISASIIIMILLYPFMFTTHFLQPLGSLSSNINIIIERQ